MVKIGSKALNNCTLSMAIISIWAQGVVMSIWWQNRWLVVVRQEGQGTCVRFFLSFCLFPVFFFGFFLLIFVFPGFFWFSNIYIHIFLIYKYTKFVYVRIQLYVCTSYIKFIHDIYKLCIYIYMYTIHGCQWSRPGCRRPGGPASFDLIVGWRAAAPQPRMRWQQWPEDDGVEMI